MHRYHRLVAALLLAFALLAGCDVNTPSTPSPLPTAGAIPEVPTAGAPPNEATPNNVAYPSPGPTLTPTPFPPGYIPPATPTP